MMVLTMVFHGKYSFTASILYTSLCSVEKTLQPEDQTPRSTDAGPFSQLLSWVI